MKTSLLLILLLTLLASCASHQHGGTRCERSDAAVIEIATFQLAPGVTPEDFQVVDQAIEVQHVAKQPGFVARESGVTAEGEWLAVVHWRSLEDADASMASFADAPATAAFMAKMDASTMSMKRYSIR